MLSSQLFFKDAAWRRRIDDFILLLLLLDDDDNDGNKRVVGLVGRLEHEHDAFEEEEEEEEDARWQSILCAIVGCPKASSPRSFFLGGGDFFFLCEKRKGKFCLEKERKKERKKEHKAMKKNADGHVVTNRIYNT